MMLTSGPLKPSRLVRSLPLCALLVSACARSATRGPSPANTVGPPKGTAIVVGGGTVGADIMGRFIKLAGGPDALIIDVPTAGGAATYTQTGATALNIRANGARNVVVWHTTDRKLADTDSFVAILRKAGGLWFEGGRQNLLVDAYAGTRAEVEFRNILARGGVIAGTSAGASIQGSFLVRGASTSNVIMDAPGRNVGFGYLQGVGIDQHVVARERLPDLADSVMNKYPDLLFISEDEGTAWVVQRNNAEVIGRNKAFVYNGKDKPDDGKPFLTLHPGDTYNLATRRVTHRAIDNSPLTQAFVDSLFTANVGTSAATVLVAQGGKVFVNASYNVPPQRRFMPTTTMPNFDVGGISNAMNGALAQWIVGQNKLSLDEPVADSGGATVRQFLAHERDVPEGDRKLIALLAAKSGMAYTQLVNRRLYTPTGMHKTAVDSTTGAFRSNVDELYRWEIVMSASAATDAPTAAGAMPGWHSDSYRGTTRVSAFGSGDGKRSAFVRFPDRRAAIIVLTDSDAIDARAIADRLADRLLRAR
jgi:cyanophycinase